jgi:hypothetical protein
VAEAPAARAGWGWSPAESRRSAANSSGGPSRAAIGREPSSAASISEASTSAKRSSRSSWGRSSSADRSASR